jgi:hypothetical protein
LLSYGGQNGDCLLFTEVLLDFTNGKICGFTTGNVIEVAACNPSPSPSPSPSPPPAGECPTDCSGCCDVTVQYNSGFGDINFTQTGRTGCIRNGESTGWDLFTLHCDEDTDEWVLELQLCNHPWGYHSGRITATPGSCGTGSYNMGTFTAVVSCV